ncbi:BPL-N domain-containing protein [Leeia aquatica]|uniref:Biotin-protein ligase N-terminal domain-containing protein n=1 Tax=Leeia aquatica TaxID=2725557 RepID=A0A847RXW0_9NEIS|nr:BPL-N domain-containing protein [Leeia aquatica]NLR74561.1 hypothetical protein [Leeia aquatica]
MLKPALLLTTLLATTPVMSQTIAIFNGAGTCDGCAEAVGERYLDRNDKVIYVNERTLGPDVLGLADVYVQPGGSDDIDETLRALKPEQVQAIRDFVKNGGHYLGICAGAYLAAQYSDKANNHKAYGLVALDELSSEVPYAKPSLLKMKWGAQTRMVYNQSGPHMGKRAPVGSSVLATYADSGRIAALLSHYGKGKVLLIGPHLEADQSWYEDAKLDTRHGYNLDLFRTALTYLK